MHASSENINPFHAEYFDALPVNSSPFFPVFLQQFSHVRVFSIKVDNSVDRDQMASLEAS